mgnify:FL=1
MKVIFLDIDGVLNTEETYMEKSTDLDIDVFRLEYLKEIIDNTKAKIVLSSSWRYFFHKENDKILPRTIRGKDLYDLFKKYGIEIYDITTTDFCFREEQIDDYLKNHDVDNFVILDDEVFHLKKYENTKLIKTNFYKKDGLPLGLCMEHIPLIEQKLKENIKMKKLIK